VENPVSESPERRGTPLSWKPSSILVGESPGYGGGKEKDLNKKEGFLKKEIDRERFHFYEFLKLFCFYSLVGRGGSFGREEI